MSHEITNNDKQQGLEMAWHKLTEVLPSIDLLNCWLAKWDVLKRPLFRQYGKAFVPSDSFELVCSDDPQIVIGDAVTGTYTPVSNKMFLETIQNALQEIKGAKVASVGSLCNRGRIFVSVQLDELKTFTAAGREFKPFLNFLSSHDQTAPFSVNTSNICTVCNNTFGMNLRMMKGQRSGLQAAKKSADQGSLRVILKHTKNVADKLENVPEIIGGFLGAQAQFRATMNDLAAQPIAIDDANALFAGFVNDGEEIKPLSTRSLNQVGRLKELFIRGAGNRGENLADVFSAGTDFYSHENSGGSRNAWKQVTSSEIGDGAKQKSRLLSILTNDAERAETIEQGRELVAISG